MSDGSLTKTYRVAKAQKLVPYCLLANVISLTMIGKMQFLLLVGLQMWLIFPLARTAGVSKPETCFWVAVMIVPFVSLLCLLALSERATKQIREAGFKIGWMGANLNDIRAKMKPATPPPLPGNLMDS